MKNIASHFIVMEQIGGYLHDVTILPPNIDRSNVFGAGRIRRALFRGCVYLFMRNWSLFPNTRYKVRYWLKDLFDRIHPPHLYE